MPWFYADTLQMEATTGLGALLLQLVLLPLLALQKFVVFSVDETGERHCCEEK